MNMLLDMLSRMLSMLLGELVTEETKQIYGDRLFDLIEDAVADSKTKIDDVTILPIVKALRRAFGIPDRPDIK